MIEAWGRGFDKIVKISTGQRHPLQDFSANGGSGARRAEEDRERGLCRNEADGDRYPGGCEYSTRQK